MTYNSTPPNWFPDMTQNHVRIGAIDVAQTPTIDHNWTFIDGTPFDFWQWDRRNGFDIYPFEADERSAAMKPDFDRNPGAWNNIYHDTPARKGVCAYNL